MSGEIRGDWDQLTGGRFIEFVPDGASPSGRTSLWRVQSKHGGDSLGMIAWIGPWRCYGFRPNRDTEYEATCLKDIADMCASLTKDHRAARAAVREERDRMEWLATGPEPQEEGDK